MSARDKLPVDNGVLRFLTAGSVDDGKSTLIGRLLYDTKAVLSDQLAALHRTSAKRGTALDLSLLTDGLTAEREQGITIDIAYRYFATARRKFIIADAPGHEQYTRNMVTAASTAHLAVLLVDARHGILTQTRRHATLAHLLGIRSLVVAVNKMDLVDFDETAYARIVADFREFAKRTGIDDAGVRYVPMSALGGEMVVNRVAAGGDRLAWYSGPTLLEILETAPVGLGGAHAGLRFPVQYVSRPSNGAGRGYLGRVEAGSVRVGDRVTVLPSGRTTTVRAISTYEGPQDVARLHDTVTIALADEVDIARGDIVVKAAEAPEPVKQIDATVCWLDERPLDVRRTYILRHATREVRARVTRLDHLWNVSTQSREPAPAALAMNDIGQATVALASPIVADRYDEIPATGSFILVDEATNGTVAAGLIR
jgi:sulfate adenylyltransferase subunit 1